MSGKPHYAYHPGVNETRDTYADEGPSPQDHERADDEQYAGDFATLVAVFRIDIASYDGSAQTFARQLNRLGKLLLDDVSADGLFHQQVFSDWGPQAVLRALATAYASPAPVLGELEHD